MNILIKSTNWVGDAVMTTPTIRALRQAYPEAHIALVAREWVAPLFFSDPTIDEVLIEPKTKPHRAVFKQQLRQREWDLGLSLPNSLSAAIVLWKAKCKRRIGYARDMRRLLLTDPIPVEPHLLHGHEVDYYLHLLRGLTDITHADRQPRITVSETSKQTAEVVLKQLKQERGIDPDAPILGIGAAAAFGTAKRWLPERFAECARTLRERHGLIPLLIGSDGEAETTAAIAKLIGDPVIDTAGIIPLDLLPACQEHMALYLTNDSGPMHLAAALGRPTVGIYGPTNPKTTSPVGPHTRIVREPVHCAPCMKRHCPIDHRCMTGVTCERVLEQCEELIAANPIEAKKII